MNKKEIGEIRRRLNPEKSNINSISGCYVNEKREIITVFSNSLLLLPPEEAEKYLSIFKRTLSGALDRNLINIAFSTSQVTDGEEHKLLSTLRSSELKDDESLNKFFRKIIDVMDIDGNYLILVMHDVYDVPRRSKDGAALSDSTQEFSYIMCSICPVKMSKDALSFSFTDKNFHNRIAEWVVSAPELGFMFPAFDDRATNIYGALYFTRSTAESHKEFTDAVFNTDIPMAANEQRQTFSAILSNTLEDDCSYDVMHTVHEQLSGMIEEHNADKTITEPLALTKGDISTILRSCGVNDEHIDSFEECFSREFGEHADINPSNIVDTKRFEVKTPETVIKTSPEHSDMVETRIIDGVKYILIRVDGEVEVNGVSINI